MGVQPGVRPAYSSAVDRFTWGIVAGAIALVVLGIGAVTLLQRAPAPPDLSDPEGVVRAYVLALDEGRPERAWDLLTTGARAGITRDEFIRRASAEGRPRDARVAIERTTVEGETARVELSRTYEVSGGLFGSSPYTSTSTVRLEREGGAWRISLPPDPYLLDRPFPVTVQVTVVATPPPASGTATPAARAP